MRLRVLAQVSADAASADVRCRALSSCVLLSGLLSSGIARCLSADWAPSRPGLSAPVVHVGDCSASEAATWLLMRSSFGRVCRLGAVWLQRGLQDRRCLASSFAE